MVRTTTIVYIVCLYILYKDTRRGSFYFPETWNGWTAGFAKAGNRRNKTVMADTK